jgi:hypothetical protein
MPDVLHVQRGSQDATPLPLLEAMVSEMADQRVGAATVMTRLADIIVARVVRLRDTAAADCIDRYGSGVVVDAFNEELFGKLRALVRYFLRRW